MATSTTTKKKPTNTTKHTKSAKPIPYVPTEGKEDPVDRILRLSAAEIDAKKHEIAALRKMLAQTPTTMCKASGAVMREPGDIDGEQRPLSEMAAERVLFAGSDRATDDSAKPLGELLADKLGNGWGTSDGNGIAAGAMRTVLGGLEVVRVLCDNQQHEEVAGDAVDDLLQGLRELGQLAIEIEARAKRASADVDAEIARQSRAVAS